MLLWNEIQQNQDLYISPSTPWVIMGDFNQILFPFEHSNVYGYGGDHYGIAEFQQLVNVCDLTDLKHYGPRFTWWNHQGDDPIGKKLDRVLVNEAWLIKYPRSYTLYEANGISDHARSIVFTSPPYPRLRYHFQFFNFLIEVPQFQDTIACAWAKTEPIFTSRVALYKFHKKLKAIKPAIRDLNKKRYGDITTRTKEAYNLLCSAQIQAMNQPSSSSFAQAADAMTTWNHYASIEEKFLQQKSRICWLKSGDRNSAFFHRSVQSRNSRNCIKHLKNNAGELIDSLAGIKSEALNHFKSLLRCDTSQVSSINQQSLQSLITYRCPPNIAANLDASVTSEEIKQALFSLPRNKSPGPDGFTVEFFTASWAIVGDDFTAAIHSYFINGWMPVGVNATKLILIPKTPAAETLTAFRPIACCNTIYKVISKIIANRLKQILPESIVKNQCAFVKGRLLIENVLLATELVKNYHKKDVSERCVLKLDISKAFDTIRWDFIAATLHAMALPDKFISWIMGCITTASFSISINGELEGFFTSSRGIRQGCAMSPYIFVIIMNVLSLSLNDAAEKGAIGYHPYCKELKLTHLCFADDLMVFMNGKADSVTNVLKVLEEFHQMSGLRINTSKSTIYIGGKNQDSLITLVEDLGIPNQEDVDLMKKLNFDAYRFSISWSRIFPGIITI